MDGTLTSSGIGPQGPMGRRGGLRRRLLAAFVVVSVVPLLALALVLSRQLVKSFESRAESRIAQVLSRVSEQLATRRAEAAQRVSELAAAVARSPLTTGTDPSALSALARDAELPALELVDEAGRIVASHHWPAGVGLPDDDGLFPGDASFRVERVGAGYGVGSRLALVAEARVTTGGGPPQTLRGGEFLDGPFLAGLSALLGVEIALYDDVRGLWIAAAASPLARWPPLPPDAAAVHSGLPETHYWAARELTPGLRLVAASPRSELEDALGQVRLVTALAALVALAVALATAVWLSQRISSPVLELAEATRRVSRGEPGAPVPEGGRDEVAQLGRAFNRMTRLLAESRDRLLQAERVAAWKEMARRLAHELKNPLFPIQLSIETLRRVHERQPAENRDVEFDRLFGESTDTIVEELGALRGIVDEFSQFARMPRPQLAATDVRAVARHVLALYAARAADVAVEIDARFDDDLPEVAADRDLLGRAVGNLVKNALEAMPGGGTLRLRAFRRDEAVALAVEDTGPGLDESRRTRLFTPNYTTKEGGTGLGLAIVQGIVSDHGGRVEVTSEPGSGTRFTIVLPAPPSHGEV